MKRIFMFVMLLVFSTGIYAQEKDVTRFLGIPVDGSKTEMIRKLKEKGFKYNQSSDLLEGRFNGMDVLVSVQENNGKVWRIAVIDKNVQDEIQIKIRYNDLCRQFAKNKKYIPIELSSSDYIIPEDENISYEITVNKKPYQAGYYQLPQNMESMLSVENREKLSKAPSEENRKYFALLSIPTEKYANKIVWFTLNEHYGKFSITIYYENIDNKADGEEL